MSVIREVYTGAGLRGVLELYAMFPDRLREHLIREHATLFRRLWCELSLEEKQGIQEYALVEVGDEDLSVEAYEAKLADLRTGYETRRQLRVQEASRFEPEVAETLLSDFERAYRSLLAINEERLLKAQQRKEEEVQREKEALLFEPSVHQDLVTVPL